MSFEIYWKSAGKTLQVHKVFNFNKTLKQSIILTLFRFPQVQNKNLSDKSEKPAPHKHTCMSHMHEKDSSLLTTPYWSIPLLKWTLKKPTFKFSMKYVYFMRTERRIYFWPAMITVIIMSFSSIEIFFNPL